MKIPPGMPRSRSFTRFTIRVAFPHLGQSVLLVVSITFLRSAVFAIFVAIYPISLTLNVRCSGFGQSDFRLADIETNDIDQKINRSTPALDE